MQFIQKKDFTQNRFQSRNNERDHADSVRVNVKSYADDPEIRVLSKSILQRFGLTSPWQQLRN